MLFIVWLTGCSEGTTIVGSVMCRAHFCCWCVSAFYIFVYVYLFGGGTQFLKVRGRTTFPSQVNIQQNFSEQHVE